MYTSVLQVACELLNILAVLTHRPELVDTVLHPTLSAMLISHQYAHIAFGLLKLSHTPYQFRRRLDLSSHPTEEK